MSKRTIAIIIVAAIVACFLSVLAFTLPAFSSLFNLADTNKGLIATVIGGITAPVIGMFSTILLVMTLNKQVESSNEQKLKNESDLIFSLINQMEKEVDSFYNTYTTTREKTDGTKEKYEVRVNGVEALNEFTRKLRYEKLLDTKNISFRQFFQSNQILMVIHSYQLIHKRIEIASLSIEMKDLFKQKLQSFYDCRLHFPLKKISEVLEMHPHMTDNLSNELELFYQEIEQKKSTPSYED